ncbi:baseplate J/gp47 family protein [Flavobacterium sp.]|uniref:baseplate J/gp47 family protein n=1 Tax=Flavobacterium sp. TaxID=239 RepID=UPI0039E6ABD2
MANCNGTLSVHEGMGTAQGDRNVQALQPDFFLLDERNEQDFIRFVQKLAAQVKFYNPSDIVEGDWAEFFGKESTAILIAITGWNVELMQQDFERQKLVILTYADLAVQKEALLDYFQKIHREFNRLLGKTNQLDDAISQKENLRATAYLIGERLQRIFEMIDSVTDMEAFLKSPEFGRLFQQLLGLLLSWKNFSQCAVDYQLNQYAAHGPHYTLFLTFLKLLRHAKDSFNGFTKKHLDFYYKDVLRMQNQKARPDFVHLVVEPFGAKPLLVPKGTVFPAGKNTDGRDKFYASTADQTINGIQLASLLSVHSSGQRYKTDLLPLNAKGKGFDAFASDKASYKEALMVASPLLYLQSGKRTIKLRINETNHQAKDFEFYLTGEEKILRVTQKEDVTVEGKKFIELTVPAKQKKIIPFDPKLHPEFLVQTRFPVLKIVPNQSIPSIAHLDLIIEVTQFKSFVLESDFGSIDFDKPFYPFGELPKNGNGLTLHSNEFFMKKNAVATLALPPEPSSGKSAGWINSRVKVARLENGQWKHFANDLPKVPNAYPLDGYAFEETAKKDGLPNGSFRIVLDSPRYEGETYLQNYIIQSGKPSPVLPYKPRANAFSFDYSVRETIDLSDPKTDNRVDLYHALAFGFFKLNGLLRFSPNQSQRGSIYLGFEKAMPKDGLSFLIQLEEGTANPQMEPANVSWHYLSNNNWEALEHSALGDETASLTRSGLVSLSVPEFNFQNTKLPAGLFWLRISVSNVQALSRLLGIHVQALKAVLTDYRDSGGQFLENTPKETISKSDRTIDGVKKFLQPYASFDGRKAEQDALLYRRTSERLRHKSRAITSWDYEHLILEEFPEVYRVKTLNHYRYDHTISNVAAGYVTLIPVAKSSKAANISWRPLLSLDKMLRIKQYLHKVASPQARICVKPPKPELVRVHFKVKYHEQPGMDKRLHTLRLIELINTYLSPWAYEENAIDFANEIEFSSIIRLIDNQSFVDYLTDFKIEQFLLDENNQIVGGAIQNLDRISPQTDFTLFIPDASHRIEEL